MLVADEKGKAFGHGQSCVYGGAFFVHLWQRCVCVVAPSVLDATLLAHSGEVDAPTRVIQEKVNTVEFFPFFLEIFHFHLGVLALFLSQERVQPSFPPVDNSIEFCLLGIR